MLNSLHTLHRTSLSERVIWSFSSMRTTSMYMIIIAIIFVPRLLQPPVVNLGTRGNSILMWKSDLSQAKRIFVIHMIYDGFGIDPKLRRIFAGPKDGKEDPDVIRLGYYHTGEASS